MRCHSSCMVYESILTTSKAMRKYSPANANWAAIITLVLAAFLDLPGLLSAQSPANSCVTLRPLKGMAPDLTPKRGEVPDNSDSHDSGDQVAATSSETTPATAPVICASLLPAANLSFRPAMSLTDTANFDHAAINEKWPHGNQQMAALPSIFWIFEWRFGPLGEAAFGNYGLDKVFSEFTHSLTWGTGVVTLVTTPVGGFVEVVGEDAIDRYFIRKLENRYSNPLVLFGISTFTPTRSMANLMRFKAPWYRDSRTVKVWMHSKNRAARSLPEGENSSPQ